MQRLEGLRDNGDTVTEAAHTDRFRHLDPEMRKTILERIAARAGLQGKEGEVIRRQLRLISSDDPSLLVHANQWNIPGHVKPGRTLRHCPRCQIELHVLAVDPSGVCITASPEGDDGFHTMRTEDLGGLIRRSRLSIQQNARHVFRYIYSLTNHPLIALRWLLGLFHGEMGADAGTAIEQKAERQVEPQPASLEEQRRTAPPAPSSVQVAGPCQQSLF